jgi:flagellar motility protein MotE (MotC chaperone)
MEVLSYSCVSCKKDYGTYKNLWAHNKSHHNGIKTIKVAYTPDENDTLQFKCRKCNNVYKHTQSRHTHEKTCVGIVRTEIDVEFEKCRAINLDKEKENLDKVNENLAMVNENLDKVNENLEKQKEIIELKLKLKSNKIDTKTFKAVNKVLKDRSTNNTMNNSNNTISYNNNIIINNNFPNIVSISNGDVPSTITQLEKRQILESRKNSLEKMVEIVHCGDHDIFKNIVITNLKDKYAYKYDKEKGFFTTHTKVVLLDEVMMYRIMDLEAIYNELSTANMIDRRTKDIIQKFLDDLESDEKYVDDTTEYQNYKSYKMNNIKILLYNNQDKITKDIALLLN